MDKLKAVGSTLAYAEHDVDADWRDVPLTDFGHPEGLAEEQGAVGAGGAPRADGHPEVPRAPLALP